MAKHIPSKIITCKEKDSPWITSKVKTAIKRNHRVYREWVNRGRNINDLNKVREIRSATAKLIKEAKLTYYSKLGLKLFDPKTGQKHFWTAYRKIINNKGNTNIDNGFFVSSCKQKADIFKKYFAKQCTINENRSVLPNFMSKTTASLSLANFQESGNMAMCNVYIRKKTVISLLPVITCLGQHLGPREKAFHYYLRFSSRMRQSLFWFIAKTNSRNKSYSQQPLRSGSSMKGRRRDWFKSLKQHFVYRWGFNSMEHPYRHDETVGSKKMVSE